LKELWTRTGFWGPDLLRKWERKYALTTEYGMKAAYGWIIKQATQASFETPVPVTAVLMDRLPEGVEKDAAGPQGCWSGVPTALFSSRFRATRRSRTTRWRSRSAVRTFQEIAGNRTAILVSALVPRDWEPAGGDATILFAQPVITRPPVKRVALVVPVGSLSSLLNTLAGPGIELEHVYDY
jgi:hypothetical protein